MIPLAEAALILAWLAAGFPLPALYVLAYAIQIAAVLLRRHARTKVWFIINLNFANMMVLHMSFIGVAALVRGVAMDTLLGGPAWRAAGVSFVLAVCTLENLTFLRWPGASEKFALEADSPEARPFMAFLWFCTGYLLLDSLLCVAALPPVYPPLFLLGSSAVLIFCIIRFLLHINAIIREEHLREEHAALSAQLAAARQSTGELKRMADRDRLTGVFSRRYIMERIDALAAGGQPFSLAFLDLDGLKAVNDGEGHDAGDRYLIRFARAVEARLRAGDLLSRVGGDEFIVLMPGCGAEPALRRISEIRDRLEQGEAPLRFSYGVTTLPPGGGKDAETLVSEADQAMYQDKMNRQ